MEYQNSGPSGTLSHIRMFQYHSMVDFRQGLVLSYFRAEILKQAPKHSIDNKQSNTINENHNLGFVSKL